MKPTVSNIKATRNFALFRSHGEQPKINPNHVRKLELSIRENGFIQAKPIHCYLKNGTYYIIDGHHRLEAAKNLNVPAYYVIGDESQSCLISAENIAVRKWGCAEFVNMYAVRGEKDYIVLSKYVQRGIPLVQAASLLWGHDASSGNANAALQDGTFRVRTTERIDAVVHVIEQLRDITNMVTSRIFIAALSSLLFVPVFDVEHLITRIKKDPQLLVKTGTREQMLDLLEDIYNFRISKKIPISFLAKEGLRSRTLKLKQPA